MLKAFLSVQFHIAYWVKSAELSWGTLQQDVMSRGLKNKQKNSSLQAAIDDMAMGMGIEGRIILALVYNILLQGKVRESGHGRSVGEMYVLPA